MACWAWPAKKRICPRDIFNGFSPLIFIMTVEQPSGNSDRGVREVFVCSVIPQVSIGFVARKLAKEV